MVTLLRAVVVSVFLSSYVFAEDKLNKRDETLTLQNVVISSISNEEDSGGTVIGTQFVVTYEDSSARIINTDEDCWVLLKHFGDSKVNITMDCDRRGMGYLWDTNFFRSIKKISIVK